MSIHLIDFDGTSISTGAPVETPLQATHAIINGFIPDNFVTLQRSDVFRDATIASILEVASMENKFESVLDTLTKAMRSSPDNSATLLVFAEYLAAVAFAWEHQDLAAKAIMRTRPENTSPFLWTIVSAIKKGMPSVMYASLVMSVGNVAKEKWPEEALTLFNIQVSPSTLTTV